MNKHQQRNKRRKDLKTVGACLGVVLGGVASLHAQAGAASTDDKLSQLEKENQTLHQRLDTLEALAQKQGLLPSGTPPKFVSAMSDITLSGFVSTSFFHDSSEPPGGISPGYLWNQHNDSFAVNKFKLTLASKPVESNGDHFEAAFRTSLIVGEDAPFVNTGSKTIGFDFLREAYVEFNIPIGTGLNVKAGELISLLNYESGDGGAANNNFSQGFQWFLTGNPPNAGVQLGYNITDWLDVKFRVQNGMYTGPIDATSSKTLMAAIGIKPMDKLWFSLIGFGGREDLPFLQSVWGASLLGGWQATDQLSFGTELDYFAFHNVSTAPGTTFTGDSPTWSAGLWTAYDFTKKVGLALRAEFLKDENGVDAVAGGVGAPVGFLTPGGTGQELTSLALTLNYKPLPNIKIQPEIRWDHTSWSGGFVPGKQNRAIFGAGVSYLF